MSVSPGFVSPVLKSRVFSGIQQPRPCEELIFWVSEMPEIESITRRLSEIERRILTADLKRSERRLRSFSKRLLSAGVIICGTLWALTVFATKGSWLPATAFWSGLAVVMYTWNYFSEKPKYRSVVRRFEDVLRRNEVHEIRIHSDAYVELDEIEDEGACFAFQLDDQRIVFVSGQDYYPLARFPNSDFSVIRVFDSQNSLVQEFVEKRGSKLKPKRRISAKAKSKLEVPEHLQVIKGDLDGLENL